MKEIYEMNRQGRKKGNSMKMEKKGMKVWKQN